MSARRTSPRLVGAVVAALVAALSVLATPRASAAPEPTPPADAAVKNSAAEPALIRAPMSPPRNRL